MVRWMMLLRVGKEDNFIHARAVFNENPSHDETMRERKPRRRRIVGTLDEAAESWEGTEFP